MSFMVGDPVEWPDAGLHGIVTQITDGGIVVEFSVSEGGKSYFTFSPQGKVWDYAVRPSIIHARRLTRQ
jgi:hypothetical protein